MFSERPIFTNDTGLIMRFLKIGFVFSVLALFLSAELFAMAEKPPIVLPDGALNAEQIKQRFNGQTAAAKIAGKERFEHYYFATDGEVIEVRGNRQKSGDWYVREDGRLCIDLVGEHRDCRMIVKDGDQYHQYAAKRDGNHKYEQTYSDFYQGNQLQKMSKQPLLPLGTLRDKEVIEIFAGKTVESVTASQGRVCLTYYSLDGTIEQVRNGVHRNGVWRVSDNDRICLKIENLREKCRIIVKEGGEYKKYIVRKNGHHQHSVSYRKFVPGKQF